MYKAIKNVGHPLNSPSILKGTTQTLRGICMSMLSSSTFLDLDKESGKPLSNSMDWTISQGHSKGK